MRDLELAGQIVRYGVAMHRNGWVANHDGNLSVRLGEDRFLITPTALSKGDLTLDSVLIVDAEGQVVTGSRRPFSELSLHLVCYRLRPDVRAVVHAHPPSATAFACSGQDLPPVFIPEAVVSLGRSIPTARLALPYGEEGAAPIAEWIGDADAMLLAFHGVLAVGNCLEQAFLRLELVEQLATVALRARALGGVGALPAEAMQSLLDRRARAGLGRAGRDAPPAPAPGAPWIPRGMDLPSAPPQTAAPASWAPAPSAWTGGDSVRSEATCGVVYGARPSAPPETPVGSSSAAADPDLAALVQREIARTLAG